MSSSTQITKTSTFHVIVQLSFIQTTFPAFLIGSFSWAGPSFLLDGMRGRYGFGFLSYRGDPRAGFSGK
jgi:hypothetical protein